jgi:Transposase, Mutator family
VTGSQKPSRTSTGASARSPRCSKDAETDILAFYAFPPGHWRKLRSTNPLERFNREVGRRTDVVGVFPDNQSLIRLAGMLCIEQNDEWLVGRAYLSAESISLVLTGPDDHPDKREQGGGARARSGLSRRRLHRRAER